MKNCAICDKEFEGHGAAKYYRDECHEYGGSWWWSHCLIKHLLNKYEGGSDDEKPPR